MVYGFFKKLFPENIVGTVEVPENIELIRLGILKTAEDHYLKEEENQFLLIPSGAWNPAGMIPIKNYKELTFELTPKGEQTTEIAYHGERKWSSLSAKIYTGFTFLLVAFIGLILWGYVTDSSGMVEVGTILLVVFGILFGIAFAIDYFLIFSRDSILASVENKVIQRIVKLASLLHGANKAEVEKAIKKRSREDFVKIARNKGIFLLLIVLLANASFLGSIYSYKAMEALPRYYQHEGFMAFFMIVIIATLLHAVAAGNVIFIVMSNIKRIMVKELIPGSKLLSWAAWLSFWPGLSLISLVLSVLFITRVNSSQK